MLMSSLTFGSRQSACPAKLIVLSVATCPGATDADAVDGGGREAERREPRRADGAAGRAGLGARGRDSRASVGIVEDRHAAALTRSLTTRAGSRRTPRRRKLAQQLH